MSSDADVIFQRLGLALAIGLLVGLERGWKAREEAEREQVAGLRTYALSGLLGGLSALIAIPGSPIFSDRFCCLCRDNGTLPLPSRG